MATALLLSLLLLLLPLPPVFSDSSSDAAGHWCDLTFNIQIVLWPGQCPKPPCSTTDLSPVGMPLPALVSFNTSLPHEAVLSLLNAAGELCGGVLLTQYSNGSGLLMGVPCDTRAATFFLPWSGRGEGEWWHLGVEVQGQTVTFHPLTLDNPRSYTLTNYDCLPALLLVRTVAGPKDFGYSALNTTTTTTSAASTTGIMGVVLAAISVTLVV